MNVAPSTAAWNEGYSNAESGCLKSENPFPAYAPKKRKSWDMGWEACKRDGLLNSRKTFGAR